MYTISVHWELTRGNNAKLVYLNPDSGRYVTRIYRGKDDPKGVATVLIHQREENRKIIEEGKESEIKLTRLEQIVNQMIQQHLLCSGYIYRNNRWQFVSNLKQPLTQDERNLIRRTKAKVFQNQNLKNRHEFVKTENAGSNCYRTMTKTDSQDLLLDRKSPCQKVPQGHVLMRSGIRYHSKESIETDDSNDEVDDSQKGRHLSTNSNIYMNTNTKEQLEDLSYKYTLNDDELKVVRNLLNIEPKLWKEFGDVNEWTREITLRCIDDHTVKYECVKKGLQELRASLLAEGSSPLEVIAIEQIITCHLQVARSGAELEDINPCKELAAMSNHWIRVHNQAQTRLFRAINVLTRLRKINLQTIVFKRKHKHIDFDAKLAELDQENQHQISKTENADSNRYQTSNETDSQDLLQDRKNPYQEVPKGKHESGHKLPAGRSTLAKAGPACVEDETVQSPRCQNHSQPCDDLVEVDDSEIWYHVSNQKEPDQNRHQISKTENTDSNYDGDVSAASRIARVAAQREKG